jgi:activator of HSP90 ATPase
MREGMRARTILALKFGTIEQKVFFKGASVEEVYDSLLDAEKHSEFTGSPATTSAKAGAAFTAWDGYITGKNLELVKAKKIVQEWTTTEWPPGYPASRLELTLTARNGGTELRMVHSKVPAAQVADYTEGWRSSYWDPLTEYLTNKPKKKTTGARHSSKKK